MLPVSGGKVIEGEQGVAVAAQAVGGLGGTWLRRRHRSGPGPVRRSCGYRPSRCRGSSTWLRAGRAWAACPGHWRSCAPSSVGRGFRDRPRPGPVQKPEPRYVFTIAVKSNPSITSTTKRARCRSGSHSPTDGGSKNPVSRSTWRKLLIQNPLHGLNLQKTIKHGSSGFRVDGIASAHTESRRYAPPPLRFGPSGDTVFASAEWHLWPEAGFRPGSAGRIRQLRAFPNRAAGPGTPLARTKDDEYRTEATPSRNPEAPKTSWDAPHLKSDRLLAVRGESR